PVTSCPLSPPTLPPSPYTTLFRSLLAHVAEVSRRVPGARVIVQLDEPSLLAVLAGRIPTPSGFGTVPAVEEPKPLGVGIRPASTDRKSTRLNSSHDQISYAVFCLK